MVIVTASVGLGLIDLGHLVALDWDQGQEKKPREKPTPQPSSQGYTALRLRHLRDPPSHDIRVCSVVPDSSVRGLDHLKIGRFAKSDANLETRMVVIGRQVRIWVMTKPEKQKG